MMTLVIKKAVKGIKKVDPTNALYSKFTESILCEEQAKCKSLFTNYYVVLKTFCRFYHSPGKTMKSDHFQIVIVYNKVFSCNKKAIANISK